MRGGETLGVELDSHVVCDRMALTRGKARQAHKTKLDKCGIGGRGTGRLCDGPVDKLPPALCGDLPR